jgi:Flp pilus assembly secretin CpaC
VVLLGLPLRDAGAGDSSPARPANTRRVSAAQVQLNVVVAEVRHGLARSFARHLLKGPDQTDSVGPRRPYVSVLDSPDFLTFLQALRDENLAKLVAEPCLVTLSGRPASFLAGGEQAVPVPDGRGQVGVQFEEFGLRLNFLPTVLGKDKLRLEVEPELSTPAGDTAERTTQRTHTTAELKAGHALLIGGLVQQVEKAKVNTVPVLGQLPVVGPAFNTRTPDQEEVELVLLVTPSLVHPVSCGQAAEVCPESQRSQTSARPHGQGNEESSRREAGERMRRLERRLQRLQEEMDDLQREFRSLHSIDPGASGEQ